MRRKAEKTSKTENGEGIYFKAKVFVSDCFYSLSVLIHQLFSKMRKPKPDVFSQTAEELRAEKRRRRTLELCCIWSVLIIPLINLFFFWVIGTINSVPIAFEYYPISGGKEYSLFNFKYLIESMSEPHSIFKEALGNSMKYWLFSWALLTPLSFLMGFFLYKRIWGYKFFRYVFYMPSLLSSVITSSLFLYMVSPNGIVPQLAEKWFGIKNLMLLRSSRTAFGTMLFYNFYNGLTGGLLYWLASFARIPQEVVEAGQLDGLTVMGEFRYLALPIASGLFLTMQLIGICGILSGGGAALLLTGGAYGTYDLGYWEYVLTISGSKQSQAIAGAVGLFKGMVTLPLALIFHKIVSKIETVEV